MANTNCLEGMSCPKCGSNDSFLISVEMVVRATDDGTELASSGDHDWHDDSDCMCENSDCEFTGKVRDFQEEDRATVGDYQVRDIDADPCEPREIVMRGTKEECEAWAERHNAKVEASGGDASFEVEEVRYYTVHGYINYVGRARVVAGSEDEAREVFERGTPIDDVNIKGGDGFVAVGAEAV